MRNRQFVIVGAALLLIGAGFALAQLTTSNAYVYKARVELLERALTGGDTTALVEVISDLERRLDKALTATGSPPTARIESFLSKLAMAEQSLGVPCVSAMGATDLIGREAVVYGNVTGARRSTDNHVFIQSGTFSIVYWSAPASFVLPVTGSGFALRGVVENYQGKPQIIITSPASVIFVDK